MKRFAILFVAVTLLLPGCAQRPPHNIPGLPYEPVAPLVLPEDDGAFVVGVQIVNPRKRKDSVIKGYHDIFLRWAGVEGGSQSMAKGPYYRVQAFCNILVSTKDVCDGMRYFLFRARPGTYGLDLAWHDALYTFAEVSGGSVTMRSGSADPVDYLLDDPKALPSTPRFSLRAGEVVYVGNVVMDFQTAGKIVLSQSVDEAAARKAIERTGLAERMVLRPWSRAQAVPYYLPRALDMRRPAPTPGY